MWMYKFVVAEMGQRDSKVGRKKPSSGYVFDWQPAASFLFVSVQKEKNNALVVENGFGKKWWQFYIRLVTAHTFHERLRLVLGEGFGI